MCHKMRERECGNGENSRILSWRRLLEFLFSRMEEPLRKNRAEIRSQGKILPGEPRFFVKEDIIRVGMFDAALVWGEDYDLYQRLKKSNVKEASCESKLYHIEPVTIKGIVNKSLRYGESIPTFVRLTKRQVFSRLIRHSLLTWGSIFSKLEEKPSMFLGGTLLLCIRAFSIMSGLLVSLM